MCCHIFRVLVLKGTVSVRPVDIPSFYCELLSTDVSGYRLQSKGALFLSCSFFFLLNCDHDNTVTLVNCFFILISTVKIISPR